MKNHCDVNLEDSNPIYEEIDTFIGNTNQASIASSTINSMAIPEVNTNQYKEVSGSELERNPMGNTNENEVYSTFNRVGTKLHKSDQLHPPDETENPYSCLNPSLCYATLEPYIKGVFACV